MGVEILQLYPCVNYQKHPPNKDFNGFQAPRSTGHHFMAPNLPTATCRGRATGKLGYFHG